MNELQLFRTLDIDTLRIAERTGQTEAEVCSAIHVQRQEEHEKSQREKYKPRIKAYAAEYYQRVLKQKRRVRYAGYEIAGGDEWKRV